MGAGSVSVVQLASGVSRVFSKQRLPVIAPLALIVRVPPLGVAVVSRSMPRKFQVPARSPTVSAACFGRPTIKW